MYGLNKFVCLSIYIVAVIRCLCLTILVQQAAVLAALHYVIFRSVVLLGLAMNFVCTAVSKNLKYNLTRGSTVVLYKYVNKFN